MKIGMLSKVNRSTHKLMYTATLLLPLLAIASTFMLSTPASAANKRDWVAENIISDAAFTDKNAMSVSQIQAFLDKNIGSCDIWGTGKATEFGSNQTRAQFAKSRGWAGPPYVCLNKYYEVPKTSPNRNPALNNINSKLSKPSGSKSAAWIIKDAANRYNISPKVLLVKIATESAGPLTSDRWPLRSQYAYAMGSYCPDSGPGGSANCDSRYAGFSIQMYSAAELMRSYLNNMDQSWWSLKRPGKGVNGSNYVGWNVAPRGCGGTHLNIANKATAALYTYTPYQPNAAALNNMYGTGDYCSAYGNRNFWSMYVDWFGSTRLFTRGAIGEKFNSLGAEKSWLGDLTSNEMCGLTQRGCYQTFRNGAIYWTESSGAQTIGGAIRSKWRSTNSEWGFLGYPVSSEVATSSGVYQQFQKGRIYWSSRNGAQSVHGAIGERYDQSGFHDGILKQPTSSEICTLSDNGCVQYYENGQIYWSPKSKAHIVRGGIYAKWDKIGRDTSYLGYPTSGEISLRDGVYQEFQRGRIYWSPQLQGQTVHGGIGARYIAIGATNHTLGYPTGGEICGVENTKHVCYQLFENGRIVWSNNSAYEVFGAIEKRWTETGLGKGFLGHPISGQYTLPGGSYQQFENGRIYQNNSTSAMSIHGAIGKKWSELGYEKSKLGYPTSNEIYSAGTTTQMFEKGSITYRQGKITVQYDK